MNAIQLAALLSLGAIWGASYIFIRVAVEPLGPTTLMFTRVFASGLILVIYARLRGVRLNIRGHWRQFLVLGALGSAIPFTLIGWAELTMTASMSAILMSTTPLFATFTTAIGLGERLTVAKLMGALLGIIGVAITVGGGEMQLTPAVLAATAALLGATFSYACGGVFAKRAFGGLNHFSMSCGQLLGASAVLFPLASANLPTHSPPAEAVFATVALVVVCTAVAYQLYYYLLISAGPLNALTVTLLVPVFGVLWGALLLGEHISAGMIVGLAVVLCSVGLVTGMLSPRSSQLARRPQA